MPARSWRFHSTRLLVALALVGGLGWLIGYPLETLLVFVVGYAAWHTWNGWQLYNWLNHNGREIPDARGLWADIFNQISALQRENSRQKEQLEATVGEFRQAINALRDAIIVMDDDYTISWFNEAAAELLDLREPNDVGQPVTHLVRDPEFANWLSLCEEVDDEFDLTLAGDGETHLTAHCLCHTADQRLLVFRDVTDIRNVDQVRRDFVANVSHELRTPLTVLIGYLEMIGDQCDDDIRPAVERMETQAILMRSLLNDLLELSRLQSDRAIEREEPVDIPAMLAQLKEQSEEITQGQHRIHFDVEPDLWLLGQASDLESAFRNLIVNAIRYTPAEGEIWVRWGAAPDGTHAFFEVEDTGIGIPKRDIPRLTERFYRVGSDRARQTGGTGLGLSIVKHVLNVHRGRLHIESELGEGSRFRAEFPIDRTMREKDGAQSSAA